MYSFSIHTALLYFTCMYSFSVHVLVCVWYISAVDAEVNAVADKQVLGDEQVSSSLGNMVVGASKKKRKRLHVSVSIHIS